MKKYVFLFASLSLIIFSIIMKVFLKSFDKEESSYVNFENVLSDNTHAFMSFNKIETKNDKYLIIDKNDYLYVLKVNKKDAKKIESSDDIDYIKVIGTSKLIDDEMKEELAHIYNSHYEDKSDIEASECDRVFGLYYLDVYEVKDIRNTSDMLKDISSLLLEIGIITGVFSLIRLYAFSKGNIRGEIDE